jgi:SAM-dependent methyltransferase
MNTDSENISYFRNFISKRFIAGEGIEKGALHSPLTLFNDAKVRYVDRLGTEELKMHYPELQEARLVEPDIIDNGEMLFEIKNDTLDFVVANHMLEHCENPLGAVRSHIDKLKTGGVCFYSVPDKRYSFDRSRKKTDFNHLIHDDKFGPESSRKQHYEEWVEKVCKITFVDNGVEKFKWHEGLKDLLRNHKIESLNSGQLRDILDEMNYSIHFHVWDHNSFLDFIVKANSIECFVHNQSELIILLRKH